MALDPSSPYLKVPKESLWREAMMGRQTRDIDPHAGGAMLKINPDHKIVSAGSCFAQRITEALIADGYNYMMVEKGPPFISDADRREMGYGIFSARYGNIYTSLQLLQLFQRAFGAFKPAEPFWINSAGRFVDPFRSGIQIGGFESEQECLWDRESHLKLVRELFEKLDIFIFTLGLTESWHSKQDGAVFPNCPGSGLGGVFDSGRHAFHNFTVSEVVEHLDMFLDELRRVNPKAQTIFTVSPVPLMATFEPRHVLQATTYSKSVLRVACEEIIKKHSNTHYFASYEIVMATGDTKTSFEEDRRSVAPAAVAHVIECFKRQFMDSTIVPKTVLEATSPQPELNTPVCDEEEIMKAMAAQPTSR